MSKIKTLETLIPKHYIQPDELREDSYRLGAKILESGFQPDFMVALWRGGAIPGCYVHELLKYAGLKTDHVAIRTSKYTGIDQAEPTVKIYTLRYLLEQLHTGTKLLIIDDVLDSGHSMVAFIDSLAEHLGVEMPVDIRVATVFYKPTRNQISLVPYYYVHETDKWIVFPHELEGMSLEEILHSMGPKIHDIIKSVIKIK